MFRKKEESKKVKYAFDIIVYVVFFGYTIYLMVTDPRLEAKIAYFLLMAFFGTFAIIYLLLRMWFDKASAELILNGNPLVTLEYAKKMEKIDLLKTYQLNIQMLTLLAYRDLRKFDLLEEKTEQLFKDERFNMIYDLRVVLLHSKLIYSGEKGDLETLDQTAQEFRNMRNRDYLEKTREKKGLGATIAKLRGHTQYKERSGDYFYQKDEVDAMISYYKKNYTDAHKKCERVNTKQMNDRELMHYNVLCGLVTKALKKRNEMKEYFSTALSYTHENDVMKEFITKSMEE